MRLPRIFRRPTPTPARMDPQEAKVIAAWGFTEAEWLAREDWERAIFRDRYTKAPRYTA